MAPTDERNGQEYIRERELANADLYEEPIDTVDYKGMGIH